MIQISDWFQLGPIPADAMTGKYDFLLVGLSYVIAVLASYVALNLVGRLRAEQNKRAELYWLIGGAFAMGAGIWSMHFIGMLAFIMPMAMEYEFFWTSVSLLMAIFASGFALYLLKNEHYSMRQLGLGGVVLGIAISTMHYMGMQGMKIQMAIHYLPGLFFLSIAVGIAASEAALYLASQSNLGSTTRQFNLKIMSALIMGAAICGMHYTGMAAAVFTRLPSIMITSHATIATNFLAFFIAWIVVLISVLALTVSYVYKKMLTAIENEFVVKLAALSDTSTEPALLQAGIEMLVGLIKARYGAIGLVDPAGELTQFFFTGITPEQAQRIGLLPKGRGLLGVVVKKNIKLIVDDIASDPRSVGLPPNHPPMKTLLAVPISCCDRMYGRIYMCDKIDGTSFTKSDEVMACSFAHSLSLVLDNAQEVRALKQVNAKLDYMRHFDELTGLPNRALMRDRLEQALLHAKRSGTLVVLMFIDLDFFKNINDTLGHKAGDAVLKTVANRLNAILRSEDSVSRQGGDEFIVILTSLTCVQDAANIAEKIVMALALPMTNKRHIGASIGICMYPDDADNADTLLSRADLAMYSAKKRGRNQYQFYTSAENKP